MMELLADKDFIAFITMSENINYYPYFVIIAAPFDTCCSRVGSTSLSSLHNVRCNPSSAARLVVDCSYSISSSSCSRLIVGCYGELKSVL